MRKSNNILSQAGLNVPRLAPKLRIASVQYIINRAYTHTRITKTMANKIFSISLRLLPFLAVAPLLMACGGSDDVPGVEPLPTERPIQFGGEVRSEVEQSTRASGIGLEDEGYKSFKIWASKTLQSDATQSVMNSYIVTWASNTAGTTESNTHDWEYVNTTLGQTIKYWDYNATSYRFWAYAGDNSSGVDGITTNLSASTDGTTFTITGLALSTTPPKTHLFSSLNVVESANFSKPVVMEFLHPYAEVRVMFFCGEALDGPVTLTDIRFAPTEGKITAKGDLKVSYSTTADRESYTVTGVEGTRDNLSFLNVTLLPENLSSATAVQAGVATEPAASNYYYVLPVATEEAKAFTMSAIIGEEPKTATVPAAYMHWQPNYVYTYIFKITEAGKKIEFYDVKIDPWQYGGSQDEEWRNW